MNDVIKMGQTLIAVIGGLIQFIFMFLIISFLFIVIILCVIFRKSIVKTYKERKRIRLRDKEQLKDGIQKSEYIKLGGILQYIQTRGRKTNTPVLLFLHGGPGNPISNISCLWQEELEKNYTIVHWDQRGCGRTYYKNKKAKKPTVDLLLSDLDELVDYLRSTYHQEKVIIVGFAWGTILGVRYVTDKFDKVSAYVGISQMVDFIRAEKDMALRAMSSAFVKGKDEEANKIQQALEYVTPSRYLSSDKDDWKMLARLRGAASVFLSNEKSINFWSSPDFHWIDLKGSYATNKKWREVNQQLIKTMITEEVNQIQFKVPVIFMSGRLDWMPPRSLALEYFEKIEAPYKNFIVIEGAIYSMFIHHAQEFSEKLHHELSSALSSVEKF